MFVLNCCEHVSDEVEEEHRVLERLINAHAAYGLKSQYDKHVLDQSGASPHRYTHLRQVLEHPAHAVMEQTRDKMREALHAGEEGWKRAGLEPDMTTRRRAQL